MNPWFRRRRLRTLEVAYDDLRQRVEDLEKDRKRPNLHMNFHGITPEFKTDPTTTYLPRWNCPRKDCDGRVVSQVSEGRILPVGTCSACNWLVGGWPLVD